MAHPMPTVKRFAGAGLGCAPNGSPMATQTGHSAIPADKVVLITPHTQETGLMTLEGAARVLGLQNELEVLVAIHVLYQ